MSGTLSTSSRDELRSSSPWASACWSRYAPRSGAPAIARCGLARDADDGLVRLAVAMPEGTVTLANLDDNGVIALTGARPTNYRTLQVKGHGAHRITRPEMDQLVVRHRAAFVDEVCAVGLARAAANAMWSTRFVAIAFVPDALFGQAPGPAAGLVLGA